MAKKGAQHHFAKLNPKKVREMREWYAEGTVSMMDLANEFGVSHSTAREAITGGTWKGVAFPTSKACKHCEGSGRVAAWPST